MASQAFLEKAYLAYFGRPVDPSGAVTYANTSEATVLASFSSSPESVALYGSTFGYAQINAIYQMLFNRDADIPGANFYLARVTNGTSTIAGVALDILNGAQNADVTVITNKIAASSAFTRSLDTMAELVGYQGNAAAAAARDFLKTVTTTAATDAAINAAIVTTVTNGGVAGSIFTLTTGVNDLVGTSGNDSVTAIIGTGATLNAGDSIAFGQGTDTIRVSYGSDVALSTAVAPTTISGVEVISLINPGVADNSVNASGVTGLTTLRIEDASLLNSTNAATSISTPAGGVNLSLATASGATTAGPVIWTANAADTTLNLTLNGYVGTGTATALSTTGAAATTLNVVTATAANKVSTFTAPATVTTLNIAAGTALTNTSTVAAAATKVNITGAGNVTLGTTDFAATVAIDASGSTGNTTVTTEATTTLTYKGGSGNDRLNFAAGELTSADSIDLGAGSNTLSLADTALGASGTATLNGVVNAITTAQTILVTGAATVDMSGVTARILSLGATSNFVVNKIEAADKVVVNAVTAGTLGAVAGLGFNTLNLELNGSATAVAAVGATDVTSQATVNILSTGAATSFGANTIAAVTNSTNASFVVTGANALTVTSLSAAASFDASAATGAITVTGANAASIIKGGTKNDVLTGATVAGGDNITGGAGTDTINTAVVTGTTATVITGGAGADAINLKGTSADSFATASSFDTVTFSDQIANGTNIVTLKTGVASTVLVGATAVTIGTTTITAGGFLAVGSASTTLTTTNQTFQIYQDSNSNGIIDATDLRVDFTEAVTDTMAVAIVGTDLVVTNTGV